MLIVRFRIKGGSSETCLFYLNFNERNIFELDFQVLQIHRYGFCSTSHFLGEKKKKSCNSKPIYFGNVCTTVDLGCFYISFFENEKKKIQKVIGETSVKQGNLSLLGQQGLIKCLFITLITLSYVFIRGTSYFQYEMVFGRILAEDLETTQVWKVSKPVLKIRMDITYQKGSATGLWARGT